MTTIGPSPAPAATDPPAPRWRRSGAPGRSTLRPVRRGPQRLERDGRVLLTRAELARVTGEREHTLYKWWAARDRNGHPDAVQVGGRSFYDEQAWRAWRAGHNADRRIIAGRTMVAPAELARVTGQPLANLTHWYTTRAENGHPEAVHLDGRRYVDEQEWRAWYAHHQDRLRTGLTEVDRSGDPDELLTAAQVCRVLGYTNPGTLTSYIGRGQFIDPDTVETLPSGRLRRRWARRRVWEFAERRSWSRIPGRRTDTP